MRAITQDEIGVLFGRECVGEDKPLVRVVMGGYYSANIDGFSIDKDDESLCSSCSATIQNVNPVDPFDTGYYNQQRNDGTHGKHDNAWRGIIKPGIAMVVYAGYTADTMQVIFTGTIDTVSIILSGEESILEIIGRDCGRLLVDGTITSYDESTSELLFDVTYPIDATITDVYLTSTDTNPYLYDIFIDLCRRAGIALSKINVDDYAYFTLRLDDIDSDFFEEISGTYDSAIQEIAKLLNARVFVDETNIIRLKYKGDSEYTNSKSVTLTNYDWEYLDVNLSGITDRAIEDSIEISGYTLGDDFEFSLELNAIRRVVGSDIVSGSIVTVDYSYANWIFKNGVNIYSIKQWVSHDEMYSTLVAKNDEEDGGMRPGKKVQPLALESKRLYYINKSMLKSMPKKLILEKDKPKGMLDEDNLLTD